MAKWLLLKKGADYEGLSRKFNIDPLIVRILVNRGIDTEEMIGEFLEGDVDNLQDPHLMKDMDLAAKILAGKIEEGASIRVIGDYDGDGVSATAILLKGLKSLGAKVDGVIPHRVKDGYGMSESMVDDAIAAGIDTILTCDNGISAFEPVKKAVEMGLTVIITDHHDIPREEMDGTVRYIVPPAHAVIDPKQEDCGYPFPGICGAFIAYKLMHIMINDAALDRELLELAAFATVTDIMEMKGENRTIVKHALNTMQSTTITGLAALIKVNGLYGVKLNAFHLGFVLGPCINAAGRIDTADKALALFMSDNENDAMNLAGELKAMNDSRKLITEEGTKKAIELIENSELKDMRVLVIYLEDCHESVAGIIAGRIKEMYYKPTLVITDSEGVLKGSARSIEAYNMYEELTKVKDVFIKFGGHPQAAGFSLYKEKLDELRQRLNENCSLCEDDLVERIRIDADAPFSYCTDKVVDALELLEPCGNGNERPIFARKNVRLLSGRLLGAEGKVGKYKIVDTDNYCCELTMFRTNDKFREFLEKKYDRDSVSALYNGKDTGMTVSVLYRPQWNEYQGRRTVQYVIEDFC